MLFNKPRAEGQKYKSKSGVGIPEMNQKGEPRIKLICGPGP
jgi:hypothetical protein